jgi:YidC/Oxa1 family membrane protein insertase
VFGVPISTGLSWLYHWFQGVPVIDAIGAYGMALILVTLFIRLVLAPLFEFQLRTGRKNLENQRKLAPELADIRKKFKGDPQKQQAAMMGLYKQHGVNPMAGLSGCLPALLQFPILTALYWVFLGNASSHAIPLDHFLFIPHLNSKPSGEPLIPGLPVPSLVYLVVPVMAAASTFVQSKMMQQTPNPGASEQEQQTQQMMQSMQVVMPLMVLYFAIITPAGLGLYWLVSNCFAIIQQYRVNGWGGLSQLMRRRDKGPEPPLTEPQVPTKRIPAKRTRKSTR